MINAENFAISLRMLCASVPARQYRCHGMHMIYICLGFASLGFCCTFEHFSTDTLCAHIVAERSPSILRRSFPIVDSPRLTSFFSTRSLPVCVFESRAHALIIVR